MSYFTLVGYAAWSDARDKDGFARGVRIPSAGEEEPDDFDLEHYLETHLDLPRRIRL